MRKRARGNKSIAFAFALLAGVVFTSTVRADLFTSRKEIERESRVQWLEMKKQLPRADARVQKYVQCVTYKIIAVLPASFQNLDWEVIVFDTGELNAFAMPGGKVGVYTGLLKVADSQDALAAVLGHEIAHLTQDHVMKRARKASRNDALVILGDAATGLGGLIQQGTTVLLGLPYDRKQESEADLVGLGYMADAGFDPRAALYLWKNMMKQSKGNPPEFLSTHPADDKRLDDIVAHLAPALVRYNKAQEDGKRPNCRL
ncbi:MAG TPA: M48 family metallopeptidase [Gammaproteobacteria bacterium]|nr:M48 family metallopeptidase [Gammaproteobacteria bacterium]